MQKRFTIIFWILLLLLMPFIHADTGPHPGGSQLYPQITNMDESQDYVLISMAQFGESVIYGQCSNSVAIIGEDGFIPDPRCYRDDIALTTVYAVKKEDFSSIKFKLLNSPEEMGEYVFSLSPMIAIKNVPANTAAAHVSSNSDAIGKEMWYYTINFAELKTIGVVTPKEEPDERVFEANYTKIILSFILTFVIETAIVLLFMRKLKKEKRLTNAKIMLYVFIINLITWPIANFLLSMLFEINFLTTEIMVMIAESFLLMWALKVKYTKALLISFIANLASLVIGWIILLTVSSAFTDSGSITENKQITYQFDASKYPVIIDGNEFPELVAFEKDISGKYETMLQSFAEEITKYGYEYECFENPAVSKLSFNYLKPKHDLYSIQSDCGIPGDTITNRHEVMFYANQGSVVMFNKADITSRFTEAFNNIESLDQLKEYSELYVDKLDISIDSALANSFLDLSLESFEEDCPFLSAVPELTSTASKEGNNFVYEGLKIRPEMKAELYYLKYSITPDGQVVKDKEELLALCPNMGIIY